MKPSALLIATLAFAPLFPASAQQTTDELQEIERQLKTRAEEEKRLRREAQEREKEVAALRHSLIETANSLQEAERKITALEESISSLAIEKKEAETALAAESENLSDVLAALQSLEMSKPPALLVSPEDANKAARAAMLLSDAAPAVEARAARLRTAIERLAALGEALASERAAYEATNVELAARRGVLADLMAQKEKERDVAASLAATAQKETARLAVEATSLRDLIGRLERLAHSVTPRIKPPPPREAAPVIASPGLPVVKPIPAAPFLPAKKFAEARGALRSPVAGRLTGKFGASRPEGGNFEGLRFSARDQAIVTAPFEGRVVVARDWRPIGNLLILDVGDGFHVLLMGVDAILVEESQRVAAGEPVARMADGGANLDLEIRKNGEPVNPALWLSRKSMQELAFQPE
ncbi:MAG: peptidoglycan DD-metalloendopeptidase family protein [Pseudomonadota bacterium]